MFRQPHGPEGIGKIRLAEKQVLARGQEGGQVRDGVGAADQVVDVGEIQVRRWRLAQAVGASAVVIDSIFVGTVVGEREGDGANVQDAAEVGRGDGFPDGGAAQVI